MKKNASVALLLMTIAAFCGAQDTGITIRYGIGDGRLCETLYSDSDSLSGAKTDGGKNRFEIVFPAAVSAGLAGLFIVEQGVFQAVNFTDNTAFWIERITLCSVHTPVYFVDIPDALVLSGITAGGIIASDELNNSDEFFFSELLFTNTMDAAFYSAYTAYSEARKNAKPGIYGDSWRENSLGMLIPQDIFNPDDGDKKVYSWKPYGFPELALSPFALENLSDPLIFVLPLIGFIQPLAVLPQDNAIWTTGKSFIGSHELYPALAIPLAGLMLLAESIIIGVCEESHFRGFIYEEIGSDYGDIAAKVTDAVYFSAIHIPTDVFLANADGLTTARNFLQRSLLTVYLDCLYDRGGLPKSIAAHMWIDFSLLFSSYLMQGGVPQDSLGSLLMIASQGVNFVYRIKL